MMFASFYFVQIRPMRKNFNLANECSSVAGHRMGFTWLHERKFIRWVLVNGNLVPLGVVPCEVVAAVHGGI